MKTCTDCLCQLPDADFSKYKGGLRASCRFCMGLRHAVWRTANPEKVVARAAAWRAENPEKTRAGQAAYSAANTEKVKAKNAAWRAANTERVRAYDATWRAANRDKRCANQARRNSAKLRAMPKWANEFFIAEAYHLASLRTKTFGFEWHVDHIVPLQSKLVCGLHNEFNLRVIPGAENCSKGNRHWPDMPEPSL